MARTKFDSRRISPDCKLRLLIILGVRPVKKYEDKRWRIYYTRANNTRTDKSYSWVLHGGHQNGVDNAMRLTWPEYEVRSIACPWRFDGTDDPT